MNSPALTEPCPHGTLEKARVYRLDSWLVVIGYIFLIPSICGFLLGGVMLYGAGKVDDKASAMVDSDARQNLEAQGIPKPIIAKVLANEWMNDDDRDKLTQKQQQVVEQYKTSVSLVKSGTGLGSFVAGGVSLVLMVASSFGILIGWFLTRRKNAVRCRQCRALLP